MISDPNHLKSRVWCYTTLTGVIEAKLTKFSSKIDCLSCWNPLLSFYTPIRHRMDPTLLITEQKFFHPLCFINSTFRQFENCVPTKITASLKYPKSASHSHKANFGVLRFIGSPTYLRWISDLKIFSCGSRSNKRSKSGTECFWASSPLIVISIINNQEIKTDRKKTIYLFNDLKQIEQTGYSYNIEGKI